MPRYHAYYDIGEFEDYRSGAPQSIDVEEPEPWVDTGLIDKHGGRIMRYQGLEPIGFLSELLDNDD